MAKGKKREVEEVNASSTADIAFLLLVFFLVTTSMSTDLGLVRRLPPPAPKENTKTEIKKRNMLVVLVNSKNQLMVREEAIPVSELKEKVKQFVSNPGNDENLAEKLPVKIDYLGGQVVLVPKNHVVSLQNDRGTSFDAYMEVQNEIVAAYNEMRDECAQKYFKKKFSELSEKELDAVKKILPMNISEAEPKDYGGVK